ncbi:MAG TPA: class II aldolase/adducin family protein [Prolixibacteraceae bacterium]|nr:class II aldolase/adducin family protein [Prolixibacteraceae bacterium]
MNEGSIRFNCLWEKGEILLPEETYLQLEASRTRLHELGLIGTYPDGIGYGNLSQRIPGHDFFYISGSGTGAKKRLEVSDYSMVTSFTIPANQLSCRGHTKASSESMTHAALYKALPMSNAVVHIHCLWLWENLLYNYPATSARIEYGTPEMAEAVGRLATEMMGNKEQIIVMGGHREGILAFGDDLGEVTELLIKLYKRYKDD